MTTTKTAIAFNPAILKLMKQYAANHNAYKESFIVVKNDTFAHGYQGGLSEDFNHIEKWQILEVFSNVERIFSFCDAAIKGSKTFSEKDISTLISIFENLKITKEKDERFSDYELLEECFAVTEFFKYLHLQVRYIFPETIAALELHQWLEALVDELRTIAK